MGREGERGRRKERTASCGLPACTCLVVENLENGCSHSRHTRPLLLRIYERAGEIEEEVGEREGGIRARKRGVVDGDPFLTDAVFGRGGEARNAEGKMGSPEESEEEVKLPSRSTDEASTTRRAHAETENGDCKFRDRQLLYLISKTLRGTN